jgi:O-acetyl-ADP-ribose deacetylase (regulator of RNase III)
VANALRAAEAKGVSRIAFPPMGAGFYGVPLEVSARVSLGAIAEYLSGDTGIAEVIVCLKDSREYKPFQTHLQNLR